MKHQKDDGIPIRSSNRAIRPLRGNAITPMLTGGMILPVFGAVTVVASLGVMQLLLLGMDAGEQFRWKVLGVLPEGREVLFGFLRLGLLAGYAVLLFGLCAAILSWSKSHSHSAKSDLTVASLAMVATAAFHVAVKMSF